MERTKNTISPWPISIILGLLSLLIYLPNRIRINIGKLIGKFLFLFPTKMKNTTDINLSLCFPELRLKDRKKLIRKNFDNLGIAVIESAIAWLSSDKKLPPHQFHGYEHIEKAFSQKKGILLVTPHFMCVELAARFIGLQKDCGIFYRPHKNSWVSAVLDRFRKKHFTHCIPSHRVKELIKTLKQNKAIWYAYDLDPGTKRGIFAPFFGIQAASLTTLPKIAALSGAAIIPMHYFRRDDNAGYDIHFLQALEPFPSESLLTDATRLNAILETMIRQHPEQYVWQYKRFKTRPKGEKRFYYSSNFPPRWVGPTTEINPQ